jgi:DNA adenine methylase
MNGESRVTGRPLFSYAGSKAILARWHATLFAPAGRHVSVFGGLATDLIYRQPTGMEVWNDCDSDLHNMFAVIRDPASCEQLQRLLLWTPDGRRQFGECKQTLDDPDPVRRAWAFLMIASTGDMRGHVRRRSWYNSKHRLCSLPEQLGWWRDRLRRVKLERLPWQEVVDRYDKDGTLLYCDPPYHPETLSSRGKLYRFALSAEEHDELLARLRRCRARVLLCGYPHPSYDSVLWDWVQLEKSTRCVMGGRGRRIERVWLNYELPGGGGAHG